MGAGWAAESLVQGHLKVPQAHRAMTVPLPEAEMNSHATLERLWGYGLYLGSGSSLSRRLSASIHDCSIARSRIERPW